MKLRDGFGEKTREERLRSFRHVGPTEERLSDGYTGRRMLRMDLPGKRKRAMPKMGFMDAERKDMAMAKVTEEDAEVRIK